MDVTLPERLAMSDDPFLKTVALYNQTRDFSDKGFSSVCYAPFVSLYFDQMGYVRVCCQNTRHVVGNVARESLSEIWHGARIRTLRDALVACDLRQGCGFCEWQFLDGNHTGLFMRRYDDFAVPSTTPTYPQLMEFSISNTCNLECIMCNGEWSSSIRSRREKKPPLPKPYSDRFFDDLREFLPHLKRANFLGGEPFLERETFRIWDMMIELGLETPCHVTTNGTQYNDKVERVLEALPFSFSISMDGTTKETVERIRQNAEFETLRENFKRFHAYCARRGTDLSLTYCLMTLNWHEFGDYLAFADDHGVEVFVNTVTFPTELSLYELPKEELERVVVGLENQHGAIDTRLTKNRHVWEAELARLRHRLDRFDEPRTGQDWGGLFRATIDPTEPPIREAEIRQLLHHWSGRPPAIAMTCDASKTILVAIADHDSDKVFPVEHLAGQKVWHMQKVLADKLGWHSETRRFEQDERKIDVLLAFGTPDRFTSEVRAMTIPLYGDHGGLEGTQTFVGVRPIPQGDLVHIS